MSLTMSASDTLIKDPVAPETSGVEEYSAPQEIGTLNSEEIIEIIKKSIQFGISEEEVYNPEKLTKWCTNITEECVQRLADLNRPFKFIVFCDVGQNIGNGMHHALTTCWDRQKDREYSQAWSNMTIMVVVTVLAVCAEISREALT